MKKVGLLGGSFDPIHNGHLQMAIAARKQLQLDEVWFVVSANTPLKERVLSSFDVRVKLVKMAIRGYRKFSVCTIEANSKGKNYTIDTVQKLQKKYRDTQFYFLIGNDQVKQLELWKDMNVLSDMVHMCAFARANEINKSKYVRYYLQMPTLDVSSQKIRSGKLSLLHPKVKRYIIESVLYPEMLLNWMGEKRYIHSQSVANLCRDIAKHHHLDETIAYCMGFYHDCLKEFKIYDFKQGEVIIDTLYLKYKAYPEAVWHGPLGRFACSHFLGITNKKVLAAIEHHVLGTHHGDYSKILFIADKLDPTRGYDIDKQLKLSYQNINAGFIQVKNEQKKYLGKEYMDGKKIKNSIRSN